MNAPVHQDAAPDAQQPAGEPQVRVPNTSMLPHSAREAFTADDRLPDARHTWANTVRTSVRQRPLACMAGALALGALIARLVR